jgi:putative tricarboxylic transport membrane protein
MKVNDRVTGFLALVIGTAVFLHTRTFPPMPGQPIGPALFPAAIGVLLAIAGVVLIASDARRGVGGRVELSEWARRPRMILNFVLVIADLLFYALVVTRLGFLVTAVIFVSVLMLAFGVRSTRILPLAAAVTLVIHYAFYTLLRVPLPWGVLEGIAW